MLGSRLVRLSWIFAFLLSGCFGTSNVTQSAKQSGVTNPTPTVDPSSSPNPSSTPTPTPTATPVPKGVMAPPHHPVMNVNAKLLDPQVLLNFGGWEGLDTDGCYADGTPGKIAIVDAYYYPDAFKDNTAFRAEFNYPAPVMNKTFVEVDLSNKTLDPSKNANAGSWEMEEALDMAAVTVVAPCAQLILVEAKSPSTADLLAAVDAAVKAGASVVSMSWGGPEATTAAQLTAQNASDQHFQVTGVTFFASSGDSGYGVSWPAVSPYVVGVGGISLTVNNGAVAGVSGWSGSGGGISAQVTQPTFQNTAAKPFSSAKRTVPDISALADPANGFPVYCATTSCITTKALGTPWIGVGGTSLASPLMAASLLLSNTQRGHGKEFTGAQQVNTAVYNKFMGDFVDVSTGSNQDAACPTAADCTATKGYDLVTGIGTPAMSKLLTDLLGI